jgi:hypothetical protein
MQPVDQGEVWERRFGDHLMRTSLSPGMRPGTIEERLWPFTATSRLDRDEQGVSQVLVSLRVLGLKLPPSLWPRLLVREGSDGSRYIFSVTAALPWEAPLGHY